MSEMVGKLRTRLTGDLSRGNDTSIWPPRPRRYDERMLIGGGCKFPDFYMDKYWEGHVISRSCNFYAMLEYKFQVEDSDSLSGYDARPQLRELATFLDSAFYRNDPRRLRCVASMKSSFGCVWR